MFYRGNLAKKTAEKFAKRKHRTSTTIKSHLPEFRAVLSRSNVAISGQIIAADGTIVASVRDANFDGKTKTDRAHAAGKKLGELASAAGVKSIAFDRSGYRYHGRVKSFAEGIRAAGLEF